MESNTNPPSDINNTQSGSQHEEMKIETMRKIKVKTITNQIYSLEVPPTILISDLKKEIEKAANVAPERQRLIYMAKSLQDEQTLNTFINDDDQTIHLLVKAQTNATEPTAQSGQTPQQTDTNTQQNQQNANAGGIPQPFNIGNLLSSFLGPSMQNLGPISEALNNAGLGNLQGQTQNTQNTQTSNSSNQGQQGAQPGLGTGIPSLIGINLSMSSSPDPNNPTQFIQSPPQVRVFSTNPLQGQNMGGFPFNLMAGQPQTTQNIGTVPLNQATEAIPLNPRSTQNIPNVGGRTVIELPHRHVFNVGSIVNSLMGQNSMFPGPSMPQLNVPRNSLVLLGGFLHSYQFQLTRLIPFISRLSDLMQRESLITNANERHQVELLAHSVGMALEELSLATTPILSLMQNVHLGNLPGEVSLSDRRGQNQGQQQTNPQASGPSLQNVSQILSGFLNPQPQNQQTRTTTQNDLQTQNYEPTGQTQTQNYQPTQVRFPPQESPRNSINPPQTQNRRDDRMEIVDETAQVYGGRTLQQEQAEAASQRLQQQPSVQSQPLGGLAGLGGLGGGNVFGQMLGQMSSMGPGLMTQTIADMIGERELVTEDEEQLMLMIGPLTIGDLFGLLTAGNTDCFDRIHPNMKEGIQKMLQKHDGNMDELVKSTAKTFAKAVEITQEHQSRVMEGFEPQTVAEEISIKHLEIIFKTILRDYPPNEKFSEAFVRDFKAYIREVMTEVSEGLYDGINDFQAILKDKLRRELTNMAGNSLEGMEGMLFGLVWPNLWQRFVRIQQENDQQNQRIEQIPEGGIEAEEALLKEISEVLDKDDNLQNPSAANFSEAYLKGDLNYEEKK